MSITAAANTDPSAVTNDCDVICSSSLRTAPCSGDNLTVRCILTDDIGAMVSTTEERFVGRPNHRGTAISVHEKPEQPHR